MKTITASVLGILLLASVNPRAEDAFQKGTELQCAKGADQVSKPYTMDGPYAIRWELMDVKPSLKDDPYWKPHTTDEWQRQGWLSVAVRNVADQKLVKSEMLYGKTNQMSIPAGGKHYLIVTGPRNVSWTIWGKEGKLQATDTGEKLVPATADESAETVADVSAAAIAAVRKKFTGKDMEDRIAGIQLVASRSSTVKDFAQRLEAYWTTMGW